MVQIFERYSAWDLMTLLFNTGGKSNRCTTLIQTPLNQVVEIMGIQIGGNCVPVCILHRSS